MKRVKESYLLAIAVLMFGLFLLALPGTDAYERYQERELEQLESIIDNM